LSNSKNTVVSNGEDTKQMYSKHISVYSILDRQRNILYTPQYVHTSTVFVK